MQTYAASRKLPHLILHPFADTRAPGRLEESSRASLMLQGLLPAGERTAEELDQALLDGRYSEIKMLFYVGRDLILWIEQCLEYVSRQPELRDRGICYQSFAAHLVHHAPAAAVAKLRKWGVSDYPPIFMRALGLNAMWAEAPERRQLAGAFIRNYYRFADQMFQCRQSQEPQFADITNLGFEFELYASGEYSRMLEREWAEN